MGRQYMHGERGSGHDGQPHMRVAGCEASSPRFLAAKGAFRRRLFDDSVCVSC